MKKNNVLKLAAGLMAASLAFTGVTVLGTSTDAIAAETAALSKVTDVKYEIEVDFGTTECVKFSWKAVDGADHYTVRINSAYDASAEKNDYEETETDSADSEGEFPISEGHTAVWFQIAAMKGDQKGEYSDPVVVSKEEIEQALPAAWEKAIPEAADAALIEKAQAKAKSDKKDGYATLTYILEDINNDGINELLYIREGNRAGVIVFRYNTKTKKAVVVKTTTGKKSFSGVTSLSTKGNNLIVSGADSAFEGAMTSYKLTKNGKLKATLEYTWNYDTETFTKNGKAIKQSTLEKYFEKAGKYEQIELYGGTEL